jgi:hypothetical protein
MQTGFPENLFNISDLNTNRTWKIHNLSFVHPIESNQFCQILNNVNYLGKYKIPKCCRRLQSFDLNDYLVKS